MVCRPRARAPLAGESFTLDTRQGGSCNCEVISFIPHCHGTHTESVGHISTERFPLAAVPLPHFIPCTLISVQPRGRAIRAEEIAAALAGVPPGYLEALVVRTLPNDASKRTRRWEDASTPYFTPEAMKVIRSHGINHLLVDLPSLDPLYDEGRLSAHRVFWDMPPDSKELPPGESTHGAP